MPSSPDLTAWVPADLATGAPTVAARAFVPTASVPSPVAAPFEFAGPSAVPEAVLAPARRAAEAAGYAAGWARGSAAARASVAAEAEQDRRRDQDSLDAALAAQARAVEALGAAASAFAAARQATLADAQDTVVDVAWSVVDALIGSVLEDDALRARAVVARLLTALPAGTSAATVHLHPADAAAVSGLPAHVTVVADASLAPGDALADVDAATVDAGLAAGLARVRGALGR